MPFTPCTVTPPQPRMFTHYDFFTPFENYTPARPTFTLAYMHVSITQTSFCLEVNVLGGKSPSGVNVLGGKRPRGLNDKGVNGMGDFILGGKSPRG